MSNNGADTTQSSDEQLNALVDGRLTAAAAAELEARVARDPDAAATLAAWRAQRNALQSLHAELLAEPIPEALLHAGTQAAAQRHQRSRWWRWGGMAASLALAFALGWSGHNYWQRSLAPGLASQARNFAHQALVAHAVYLPEQRHAVEVTAAQQEHLVQWLSKRLGRQLKVPTLAAQGYELVGGRLLPGEQGARAQFMYQNPGGQRITLYLGAVGADRGKSARETAFLFAEEGSAPAFYWVDQGFGYALAGKLSRSDLLSLATVVHDQL
jgi:anti-sigma factor RsiW